MALPEGGFGIHSRSNSFFIRVLIHMNKDPDPIPVPPSTLSQPIPIDTNGDMKIDLLGITPQSVGSSTPIQIWQNAWNASQPYAPMFNVYVYATYLYRYTQLTGYNSVDPKFDGSQCTLANPHSNAVVDLNGDCLAGVC
jgi:integrin alpha FG-GAP repeat containing protein 1